MKQLCQNKHTIRFRYWSRKKYAMFYSLGKYVTIGNLKKEIADVSLGKQANVCTAFSVSLPHEKRMLERNMKKECPLLNLCCKCFGSNCLNHRWLT